MGHNSLPPARSGLSFGENRLFEHVLALEDANTPKWPTIVYILLLFSSNFKFTLNNYKFTCFKACWPGQVSVRSYK